jgi:hypothetical protein
MGSNLITKKTIETRDYPAITAKVRDTLNLIQAIRGK